jgi:pSer/pThr/pTyr-binding forkhead associated (FHA) protein
MSSTFHLKIGDLVHLLNGKLTIGRGVAADLKIPLDKSLSRVHCTILKDEQRGVAGYLLYDGVPFGEPSRNGVFVNGDRIKGVRRLKHGDMILVGKTEMIFEESKRDTTDDGDSTVY